MFSYKRFAIIYIKHTNKFERSFNGWLSSLVKDLGAEIIPIDGKTLKGSYDRNQEQSALHLVGAWASQHRLFLGQVKVDDLH